MVDQTKHDREIVAWLNSVIAQTGLKPTPLAKAAGLAPSTLLRALNPKHVGSLERRSISKIVEAFNIDPPNGTAVISFGHGGFSEPEVVELDGSKINPNTDVKNNNLWEKTVNTRALELIGYLPGDIITASLSLDPQAKDIVLANVYDVSTGTAFTVLRYYDPPYLVTRSSDPNINHKPLLLDNERVSILSVVVELRRKTRN